MAENINELSIYEDILDRAFSIPFKQTSDFVALEQELYSVVNQNSPHICGLIAMMFLDIAQGKRESAKELAYRIWEIGGELPSFFEITYIENLLNLGLVEMASVLVKPRFEALRENIEDFYSVLSMFAVQTGSLSLLNRLSAFNEYAKEDALLYEFSQVFQEAGCVSQFKDIQKLVLENIKEDICAYEYNLYDDRGFADLEIVLYIAQDDISCLRIQNSIDRKIEAYWLSSGKERLYNLSVVVSNIKDHDSWIADETE